MAASIDLSTSAASAVASRSGSNSSLLLSGCVRVVDVVRLGVVLLIVGNLGYLPVAAHGQKEAPLFLNDLLVMTIVAIGIIAAVRSRRLVIDSPVVAALCFATVGGLSTVLAIPRFDLTAFQFAFSIAYLLRWLAYFGVYVVVINFVRREDVHSVWGTLEKAVLVFALFGIFQTIFLPGFAQVVHPGSEVGVDWDAQGRRLVSTFLDPNFAGALLVIVLLVLLARIAMGAEVARWKLLTLATALILTLSRSSVLGFLAGSVLILAVRGLSKRVARLAVAGMLLLIPLLPFILSYANQFNKLAVDASALTRVIAWLHALQILADHPIIGIGFNTFGFVQDLYGYRMVGRAAFALDGGLLFVAVLTGLVGLAFYIVMIGLVVARCRRIWKDPTRPPEDRGLALGVAAATIALVVHSTFLNSLFYPFLMETVWVLWGLTFCMTSTKATESGDRSGAVSQPRVNVVSFPSAPRATSAP